MKVVRQVRLELSGGSTPDQLRPPAQQSDTEALCHPPPPPPAAGVKANRREHGPTEVHWCTLGPSFCDGGVLVPVDHVPWGCSRGGGVLRDLYLR